MSYSRNQSETGAEGRVAAALQQSRWFEVSAEWALRPLWFQYAFVVVAVALLTIVRLGLDPALGLRAPFMFHLVGLFLIALLVGSGPYILAAALSLVLAALLFIEPRGFLLGGRDAILQVAIYAAAVAMIPLAAWPARAAHLRALREGARVRQSEQRFRLALSHSQVVVYTTDLEMRATWIYNPHPYFRPEDIIGKQAADLMPDGGGAEVMAVQREVLESGEAKRRTVSAIIGGERCFYDLWAEPLLDGSGKIIGIAAAASDITSHVHIEEDLRSAQHHVSQLWQRCAIACEAGGMGEWSWNIRADCITWSAAMCRVMGAPHFDAECSVLTLEESLQFIHPEDRQHVRDIARRLLDCDEQYQLEFRVLDIGSGPGPERVRWVEKRGRLERDQQGQPLSVTGVALDVTNRRLAEDAMARLNETLARSNDDLEDFAHIVSHDLKEPLRGISEYAAYVLEDDGPGMSQESRDRMETIHRLAERLSKLLDALLQYSRVGRTDMGVMECSLGDLAAAAVQRLGPWLEQQNATVEIDPDLPRARCDAVRIEEVFCNLIANAVKYNESRLKTVRIGARPENAVFVQDNGIGIAARNTDAVFSMFRRLHGRDAYGGGTGSGLAITRKIIERHHGKIWVESELGCGSTFYFTLGVPAPCEVVTACASEHTACCNAQ